TRTFREGLLTQALAVDGRVETARAWQSPGGSVTIRADSAASAERLRWLLALDDDHSGFLLAVRDDPLLGHASRQLRGLRPVRVGTVAQALLRAFCGQLIEAKRARRLEQTIVRSLCSEGPGRLHVAPTGSDLGALAPSQLRRLGLHARRGAALVRLCRSLDLERLHDQPTEAIVRRLGRERGLGPWSVGVVCLEGLGRYDHGLVGDLGLIKLLRAMRGREVDGADTAAGCFRSTPQKRHRQTQHMIAILGCGRIGEALLGGLLGAGWKDIVVTSRTDARTMELRERHGVEATTDNAAAVAKAELVVVAVKPQDIDALLAEVGPLLTVDQTILSIAAAIPTAQIEARVADGVPVVRAMPNAPSIVHEGMAGICAGAHAGEAHLALAEDALAHLGRVVRVPESAMDAVTALS